MPNCEFIEELHWDRVAGAGERIVECNEGHWTIVVTEVQCLSQSVFPEPITKLPEGVCFWGEDNKWADIVSSFTLECGNEVVNNLSFLELDEEEVAHRFLCGFTFDEGVHALVYTFGHHFVGVFRIAVSCIVREGAWTGDNVGSVTVGKAVKSHAKCCVALTGREGLLECEVAIWAAGASFRGYPFRNDVGEMTISSP